VEKVERAEKVERVREEEKVTAVNSPRQSERSRHSVVH
jgi:hypothetical protein